MGIIKLKDAEGYNLSVWDGENWTRGDILYSGKKQKCIVTFRGGQQFICSPDHKFLVKNNKGKIRFVACQDLLTVQNSRNPNRICFNLNYEPSGNVYDSMWAKEKYHSQVNNSNNVYLEDIENSFLRGQYLGRLASDGTFKIRENGGSYATQIIAEHEYSILNSLEKSLKNIKYTIRDRGTREGRTQGIKDLTIYSKSLVHEIEELDIKHQIHDKIFEDTEMLRGFLSGLYDGDGGISGKTITLVAGVQYDFEDMFKEIQKALLFFGIRSRFRKYPDRFVLAIKTNDNIRFLDFIGFINKDKQSKGYQLICKQNESIFGPCLLVESVEITDEYIDMYDVCNTERGYYVADGLITHNTAADIYKQSVNNMFVRICKEGWLGKVLINGFIHDEMLIEVHKSINPYYFFKVWRDEFEVRPAHYCKLYAGAGVGKCWYDAKKLDLPPLYIQEIIDQYQEGMPWNENFDDFLADVKKGFKQHKINRIREYITDEKSQGEIIKPAISSLLGDEMDNVISGVLEDDLKLEELNSILEKNKIEKDKKNKISGLQEQLKAFCYYYGVDYSKIDIKSPDDVSVIQNNTNDMEDSDEDEVVIQVDKSQLLEVGLISNGIIADYETMTVHMGELMLRSKDKFIKGTAHFIQKDLIVKQTEDMSNQQCYKIKYYPNLKGEHPKGVIIDGYVIPKDNLPVLLHFYKEMISRQYAFLVNR